MSMHKQCCIKKIELKRFINTISKKTVTVTLHDIDNF